MTAATMPFQTDLATAGIGTALIIIAALWITCDLAWLVICHHARHHAPDEYELWAGGAE